LKTIINTLILIFLLVKCTDTNIIKQSGSTTAIKILKKPGSSFHDTLIISQSCALFYQPDSLQKERIKAATDPRIFEGSMHEFLYQQKTAHAFLKRYWPRLKIVEVSHARYLLFKKNDRSTQVIDLDQLGDSFGMIVFDPIKNPQQMDMTNIETQVPDYFTIR